MKTRIISFTLVCLALSSFSVHGATHHYRETIHDKTTINWISITKDGDAIVIKGETRFDQIEIHCNPDMSTQKWIYIEPKKTHVTAVRKGDIIHIDGTLLNAPINTTIEIDENPWIQLPSMQLPPFVTSSSRKHAYWILAPDSMEATLLIAQKKALTDIDIDETNYPAIHIKISPPGFKSFFWEAHYWFRQTDGQFLEFKGPRGGLGAPKSHIQAIFKSY